jgi:hypothetical protein
LALIITTSKHRIDRFARALRQRFNPKIERFAAAAATLTLFLLFTASFLNCSW